MYQDNIFRRIKHVFGAYLMWVGLFQVSFEGGEEHIFGDGFALWNWDFYQ